MVGDAEDEKATSPTNAHAHNALQNHDTGANHILHNCEKADFKGAEKGYSFIYITYPYRHETSSLVYCTFSRRREA